jgi:hypothetical protein
VVLGPDGGGVVCRVVWDRPLGPGDRVCMQPTSMGGEAVDELFIGEWLALPQAASRETMTAENVIFPAHPQAASEETLRNRRLGFPGPPTGG